MKIQNVKNNVSFSGLMIENMEDASCKQKSVVGRMICDKTLLRNENLLKGLDNHYSDIYVTAKPNGNIELKVLHAAGLNYNYIPRDNNGDRLKVVLQHNILKKDAVVYSKVKHFIDKVNRYINRTHEHPQNKIMERCCENLSECDILSRHQKVSRPEFLPDAACFLGIQQVETKERKTTNWTEVAYV